MKSISTIAFVTASRRDTVAVSTDTLTWLGELGVVLGGQCPLPALVTAEAR